MTIYAYARNVSVHAGEDLELCVSTDAPYFRVQFLRQGETLQRVPAMDTDRLSGWNMPLGPASDDWRWPVYKIRVPSNARSGPYVASLIEIDDQGRETQPDGDILTRLQGNALVVVRPSRQSPRAAILYKLSTATYQAYNEAGGASFYSRATWWRGPEGEGFKVTLRRTGCGVGHIVMCGEGPDPYNPQSRRQSFAHWDAPFVSWLDRQGITCDFCTDFDLEAEEDVLDGYCLLISAGHDEYWSAGIRQRIVDFVGGGGNVAYFSGNIASYRIWFADNGTAIYSSKSYAGQHEFARAETDAWHAVDPNDIATGVSIVNGGGWWDGLRALDGYAVQHADHWVFTSTGLSDGDVFGTSTGKPVLGYEVDGTLYRVENGKKVAVDAGGQAGNFTILGIAVLSEKWVTMGPNPCATMGVMTHSSGGITFQAATTDWPMYVDSDATIGQITRNVIERLSLKSVALVGPVPNDEDAGLPSAVEGETCVVYADLGGLWDCFGEEGLRFEWSAAGGDVVGISNGPVLRVRPSSEGLLTVSLRVHKGSKEVAFGSKTALVSSRADGLRIAICTTIRNVAMPTDPGACLFAPTQAARERIRDVSPSRLGWLRSRANQLSRLTQELEDVWRTSGEMVGTTHEPEVVRWDRYRWPADSTDS